MPAETISVSAASDPRAAIERAARVLAGGGLVVFPTETVYGVAASAASESAVERLNRLKGAAAEQPFTVHVARSADADAFTAGRTPVSERLMAKGWPGPLTLVFPAPAPEQTAVYAGLSPAGRRAIFREKSVGLRCPDEPSATALLELSGVPVIAASANHAGRPAPTDAESAALDVGAEVDLVLDGGRSRYGRGSTIVAVEGDGYRVVREGVYDARTVRRLAMLNILFVCSGNTCRSPMAAGICADLLARRLGIAPGDLPARGVSIISCGTSALDGARVSEHSAAVLARRGIDISGHRAQLLRPEHLQAADHVFVMTESHRRTALELSPRAADRIRLLSPDGDIADPIGGRAEDYAACADAITAGLQAQLKDIHP